MDTGLNWRSLLLLLSLSLLISLSPSESAASRQVIALRAGLLSQNNALLASAQEIPRPAREQTVYVDGTALASPVLSTEDGSRHYTTAAEFLGALDRDFWAGETLDCACYSCNGQDYLCIEDFCREHGLSLYREEDDPRLWCSSAAGEWQVPTGYSVPVLMYHGVGDDLRPGAELVVRTEALDEQLALLRERGYTPIWFEDLKHVDQIEKPILLTFDDGYLDNYTELFPLLLKYRMKATLFLVSGYLDNPHTVGAAEIREMLDSGLVSIQCHTQYHLDLDTLSREQQEEELCWSKVELLKLTNREPYVIAYPRGRQNEDTLEICRGEYRFGVKMGGAAYVTGDDPLLIHRIGIYRSTSLAEFASCLP